MDNKTTRTLTILVGIVSVSVVLLGVGIATGLSSYYYSSSAGVYKQVACLDKVHEFAQSLCHQLLVPCGHKLVCLLVFFIGTAKT